MLFLTSATGQDIASLPAGRARPPHAVMLPCGLSGSTVRAGHVAWLETVASAGGGALRPRPYMPVQGAGLCGAVLHRAGPKLQYYRKGIGIAKQLLTYNMLSWYPYLPLESTAHLMRDFGGIGVLAVNMAVLRGDTGTHTLTVTLKEDFYYYLLPKSSVFNLNYAPW